MCHKHLSSLFPLQLYFQSGSKMRYHLYTHCNQTCHSLIISDQSFPSTQTQKPRCWLNLRWCLPGTQVALIPHEAFCPTACSGGNSRLHPLRCNVTTSSLPLLCFPLLFNYPQLSWVFFVSSGRGNKIKEINRLLPRCMQIFAQTPLSRWEMW